jgi:hypothetical protein
VTDSDDSILSLVAASSRGYAINNWIIQANPFTPATDLTVSTTDNGAGTLSWSGTDVPAGTYPVTVTAFDSNGVSGSYTFNIDVTS